MMFGVMWLSSIFVKLISEAMSRSLLPNLALGRSRLSTLLDNIFWKWSFSLSFRMFFGVMWLSSVFVKLISEAMSRQNGHEKNMVETITKAAMASS